MNNLTNNINFVYFNKIDEIYHTFTPSLNGLQELLFLIYNIYYKNDQFNLISPEVKSSFNSTLKLLMKKHNLFYSDQSTNTFDFQSCQDYINLLIMLENNHFDKQFKNYIVGIVQHINPVLVEEYDVCIYDQNYIKNWFNKAGVDLTQNPIVIQGVKIPNIISLHNKYPLVDLGFEFYHLLFKIYKPLIERNFCFYEADGYKITNKDIVLDCGSNMGLFAAYAASKGAKVYCFEPMSYIRNYLQAVKDLYPDNIIIIPYALGEKEQVDIFRQSTNPGECRSITNGNITNFSDTLYSEKVKVINLDSFIELNQIIPTFIKMDIEGGELSALKGCKTLLIKNKPVLSISLDHNESDLAVLPNFIESLDLNYQITYFNKGEGINNSLFMLCQ